MLHILLLILKIIGIIIAAILGILVLFLCVILFVPVRYEIQGKCDGTLDSLKGKITVTWLLHLFRVDVLYKEKRTKWKIRIAWKKMSGGTEKQVSETSEAGSEIKTEKNRPESSQSKEPDSELTKEDKQEILDALIESKKGECQNEERKETTRAAENVEEKKTETTVSSDSPKKQEKAQKDSKENEASDEKGESRIRKIKCTFRNFCDKIKQIQDKKDTVEAFIKDAKHRKAFDQVKKALFTLLRRWMPRKLSARVIYGLEDPYLTGKVLAGLAVLYPFMGDSVEITPDFEHPVLKGNLYIKGHIRVWHLAGQALRILLSGAVRRTYKDIKNFEW